MTKHCEEGGAAAVPPMAQVFCGLDIGAFSTVVASSGMEAPLAVDVDVNNLSNRATPSMVTFTKRLRLIGEGAEDKVTTCPQNTVTQMLTLFAKTDGPTSASADTADDTAGGTTDPKACLADLEARMPWRVKGRSTVIDSDCASLHFEIENRGKIPLRRITAFFMKSCLDFAVKRRKVSGDSAETVTTIAVPTHFDKTAAAAVASVCRIAGLSKFCIVRQAEAIRNLWVSRNVASVVTGAAQRNVRPPVDEGTQPLPIVLGIVDFGFAQTSIQFLKITPSPEANKEEGGEEKVDDDNHAARVEVLAQFVDSQLGVADMVRVLVDECKKRIEAKHVGFEVDLSSRKGWRLATLCTKLLKDLSGLPSSGIEIEGFIDEDTDFSTSFTREEFENLCQASKARFRTLMTKSLEAAKIRAGEDFVSSTSVCFCGAELVGGGTRVPWVIRHIGDSFGCDEASTATLLRRTMDSSAAAASGAALFSAGEKWVSALQSQGIEETTQEEQRDTDVPMDFADMVAAEAELELQEEAEVRRQEMFNSVESFILKMRSATTARADLFGDSRSAVEKAIGEADDKLLGMDSDETSLEEYTAMMEELNIKLRELCPKYFEAVEAERLQKEQELLEAAQKAREEAVDVDDHDSRKLPTSQRLKKAQMNKDEGNELFKGKSLEMAAQRYIKALSHLAKIFDASPNDIEESNKIKLACHLNLAQVYLRLETESTYNKAAASASAALEIQSDNIKAYFRRATAYEKLRKLDLAMKDLKSAQQLADGSDPEVERSAARVQRQIDIQEAKAKKMYARMFGGGNSEKSTNENTTGGAEQPATAT